MTSPTSFLPPLKRLDEFSASDLHSAIARLVVLYLPEVRGTAPVDEDLELLQADTFERSFAIRWLTGFIARGEEWVEQASTSTPTSPIHPTPPHIPTDTINEPTEDTYDTRSSALDRAAALLAACAGTSASGAISREFIFPTSTSTSPSSDSSSTDAITITIRDESLSVGDHTAVGLQTWGSAYVLGERVAKDPTGFGVHSSKRVLEIGAGTGLLALLCGKLVELEENGKKTGEKGNEGMVVATDYHPAVLSNLSSNISSNFLSSQNDSPPVRVLLLDWSICVTGKPTTNLSRAPSTAVTPAIGTPAVQQPEPKLVAPSSLSSTTQSTQIQTPAFSTSTTSLSPISTPRTPQTPRSPPPAPNLARAVFSRLMARGVQFDMPGEGTERLLGDKAPGVGDEKALGSEKGSGPSLNLMELDEKLTAAVDDGKATALEHAGVPVSVAPAANEEVAAHLTIAPEGEPRAVEVTGGTHVSVAPAAATAVVQDVAADQGALAPTTAANHGPATAAHNRPATTVVYESVAAVDESVVAAMDKYVAPVRGEPKEQDKAAIILPHNSYLPLHMDPLAFLCAPSGDFLPLPVPQPEPEPGLETDAERKSQESTAPGPKSSNVPETQSSSTHFLEPETQSAQEPTPSIQKVADRSSHSASPSTHTQAITQTRSQTDRAGSTNGPSALSARTRYLDSSCPVHVSSALGFLDTQCLAETASTNTRLSIVPGVSSFPVQDATCPSMIASLSCAMPPDANCRCGLESIDAGLTGVDESLRLGLDMGKQVREEDEVSRGYSEINDISLDKRSKSSGEDVCPNTRTHSEFDGQIGTLLEDHSNGPELRANVLPRTPGINEPELQQTPLDKPFDEPFDTIFGADVIYELSHATLVHGVVSRLLRKPSYNSTKASAHFHLIMPLRPTHADEATSVDRTFPRAEDVRGQKGGVGDEEVLAIVGTETYARSAGVGRADEVQYVYYRIGWVQS